MKKQYKTGESQRKAVKAYQERNKGAQKGIGATYATEECDYIQSIFKAHKVKPSKVLRGAAAALLEGQQIRTQSEPLTIPAATTEPDSTSTDAAPDPNE